MVFPQSFYQKMVPFDVNDYYSIIDDPRNEYNKLYSVQYLGNVVPSAARRLRPRLAAIRILHAPLGLVLQAS